MINIIQRKAAAGAVNLTSDFDDIAINGMKNLSATLKALIFGFHEDKTNGTAVLQGLQVSIDSNANKISVSSGVAVTKVGVYPFFVNATVVKELTPEERNGIGDDGKYLVLRPNVKTRGTQEQRLVKTPEGTYEEQSIYSEQALQYFIELVDTPQNDDLTFGKVDSNLKRTEDSAYPILRLSRTLDQVTGFLDTANIEAKPKTLMLRDENGRAKIASPSTNDDIANKVYVDDCINTHEAQQDNPHKVTKAQIGLGNCDNTADKDKQVATATKLTTNAGSATKPVYFSDGKPVAGTYTLGNACSKAVKSATSTTHCNYSTDKEKIPDISMLAYWNGAYNSDNKSNLAHCAKGAFGDAATKTEAKMQVLSAKHLQLKGTNGIGTTNDTPAKWAEKGSCVWYFKTKNQLNGQPSQYGVLLNLVTSSDIKQMFFTCSSGDGEIYQRGGLKANTDWHATGWRKMFDNKNLPSATINVTRMHATATNGLTLSSFDTDAITTGSKTGLNIGIDANEIQARNNGAAAELCLNICGGPIEIGTKGKIDGTGLEYNGNAATATKLTKTRTIKIQDSSGSNTGTEVNFDGSGNVTIKLPATMKANITGNCSGSSGSCTGNAATATKATKATQDENGNNIKTNYAASLAVSGKTVTLKSKSGATLSTITTQDTTYGVATTSANGLMPKEDKDYIDKLRNYFYFGSEDSYLSAKTSGGTKYSFVILG